MSYSIIFETKVVHLPDGRLMHLSREGCNNDDEGRKRSDFRAKMYTRSEWHNFVDRFLNDPATIEEAFVKIGSRYCTMKQYGEHLERMEKRDLDWNKLCKNRVAYAVVLDGIRFFDRGNYTDYSPEDAEKLIWRKLKEEGSCSYCRLTHTVNDIKEIVKELDSGSKMTFTVGKEFRHG